MPVQIIYHPGGKVTMKPCGYPGDKCFEATRPYEEARNAERTVAEGESEVAIPVTAQQQQKLRG